MTLRLEPERHPFGKYEQFDPGLRDSLFKPNNGEFHYLRRYLKKHLFMLNNGIIQLKISYLA